MRIRSCFRCLLVFTALIIPAHAVLAGEITDHPLLGKSAPDFTLEDLNGKIWTLSSLENQKVVLLDFGRIGCNPCRTIGKELQKLHDKYRNRGLQVLAVNLDAAFNAANVAEYVKNSRYTYPFLRDADRTTVEPYGIEYIPHIVIVDRSGIVRFVSEGYDSRLPSKLKSKIEPLLPEQAHP